MTETDVAAYRGRLPGYLLGRAAVLAALLVISTFAARPGGLSLSTAWLSALSAAGYGVTLASALALRQNLWPGALARLQPAWDVAYVTALVYLSGGAFSPFVILYPLAIIGGAILLFRKGALVTAAAASLAYGLLADLQLYAVLRPPGALPATPDLGARLLPHLGSHVAAFFVLALLAGYLAEELRRTGERLEVARAEVLGLERLQESILRSLPSGVVALDAEGREVFHNRAADELLARADVTLHPGAALGTTFDLSEGDRREAVFGDGSVTLGYSASPLHDGEGRRRGSILIFQDLTQIKHLEDDLRRSDRLAAVGRLAAGLAHEIRNPLASLAGSVEVLRESLAPGEEEARLFAIVLRETERLNRLVTNFLHYARPGRAGATRLDLRECVAEAALFFRQGEGRAGFTVENGVPEGLTVRGDASQLQQVFLNLFRNSREAAAEVQVTVSAQVEGAWIDLWIADDGPGMPPEVAERAFEPFFSGREGGTGLGLATVHRIVENQGGSVALESRAGAGTAFRIRLPRGEAPEAVGTPVA